MFQKKYNGLLFEKIGLLVTERYSIIIKGIIIYLDKNYYNGQIEILSIIMCKHSSRVEEC